MLPILMKGIRIMRFRKVVVSLMAVSGILGVGAMGFLHRDAFAKEANAWHVLPQAEHFSELYFTNPGQLPKTFTRDQTVTFTVHNLENRTTVYGFTIFATPADTASTEHELGEGTFTLDRNQSQVTKQHITLPPLLGRTAVRVMLHYDQFTVDHATPRSHQQSINYWIDPSDKGTK